MAAIKEKMDLIKGLQAKLQEAQFVIRHNCSELATEIDALVVERLAERFPNVKFKKASNNDVIGSTNDDWRVSCEGGCFSTNWRPGVYFSSIGGNELSTDGVWFKYSEDPDDVAPMQVETPIDLAEFRKFLEDFGKEFDMECMFFASTHINFSDRGQKIDES